MGFCILNVYQSACDHLPLEINYNILICDYCFQGKRGIVKPPFELPEFIKVCIKILYFVPLWGILHVQVKFLEITNE